jgi:hypothetical protein
MKPEGLAPFVVAMMSDSARLLSGTIIDYDAGSEQIDREI